MKMMLAKKLDTCSNDVFVVKIHFKKYVKKMGLTQDNEYFARIAQEALGQSISFNDLTGEYSMWDYASEAASCRATASPIWVEAWKIKPCRYIEINLLM